MKPNKDSASQPKSRDTRCHEHTTSHLKYKEEHPRASESEVMKYVTKKLGDIIDGINESE